MAYIPAGKYNSIIFDLVTKQVSYEVITPRFVIGNLS